MTTPASRLGDAVDPDAVDPGAERGWRALLALVPFVAYMIAVAVFALPDGKWLSWIGMMFAVVGLGGALLQLTARRPAARPTTWRILWTTLWPIPLALAVVLVALSFINENTEPGSTRRSLLYLGGGLLMLTAGTLAFVWWMRETRRQSPTESVGRG